MYKFSEAAATDLDNILDWSVEEFGVNQTENYYRSLSACLDSVAKNPSIGLAIDDIRAGYRRFPYQSHVIFYQQMVWGVLIVRILHKRMDVTCHL